jgi:glutathione S-transferase
MIKIYGSPHSSAGRCYWTLEELGLDYERVKIDMRNKEHKSPEFLRLNPNGKVPVMIEDDFVLWESAAINSYLAAKYRPALLGRSLQEQALVNQWTLWGMIDLQPPHVDLLIQMVFVPAERRDHGLIERAKKSIPAKIEILDKHLTEREFVVGDVFSLADIDLASIIAINSGVGNDISQFKGVKSWLDRLSERPSYKKLVSMER